MPEGTNISFELIRNNCSTRRGMLMRTQWDSEIRKLRSEVGFEDQDSEIRKLRSEVGFEVNSSKRFCCVESLFGIRRVVIASLSCDRTSGDRDRSSRWVIVTGVLSERL
jgi:hypothetical protein